MRSIGEVFQNISTGCLRGVTTPDGKYDQHKLWTVAGASIAGALLVGGWAQQGVEGYRRLLAGLAGAWLGCKVGGLAAFGALTLWAGRAEAPAAKA